MKVFNPETNEYENVDYNESYVEVDKKPQNIIKIELENLQVLPDPKRVQPNGTVYISTAQRGRYVKAVIFEEE